MKKPKQGELKWTHPPCQISQKHQIDLIHHCQRIPITQFNTESVTVHGNAGCCLPYFSSYLSRRPRSTRGRKRRTWWGSPYLVGSTLWTSAALSPLPRVPGSWCVISDWGRSRYSQSWCSLASIHLINLHSNVWLGSAWTWTGRASVRRTGAWGCMFWTPSVCTDT